MNAAAAAESEWVQLLDEASKSFYYANIVTHETSWDAPPSFMCVLRSHFTWFILISRPFTTR